MLNFYHLCFGHLKNSKKIIIIASIGLILSLTIISSTNYLLDNSKKELLNYYGNNSASGHSSDLSMSIDSSNTNYTYSRTDLSTILNQTQKDYGINYFKTINITSVLFGLTMYGASKNDNYSVQVIQLNSVYLHELMGLNQNNALMSNSKLPNSSTGVPEVYVLYIGTFFQKPSMNPGKFDLYGPTGKTVVNVTGASILNPSEGSVCNSKGICLQNKDYLEYPVLTKLAWTNLMPMIFTDNMTEFSHYLTYNTTNTGQTNSKLYFRYLISIGFDYSKLDPTNAAGTISQVNSYDTKLIDSLSNSNEFKNIKIDFANQSRFQEIIGVINGMFFNLLLISIPSLLITVFVIYFSFNLIHSNVVRNIGIYKTRGASVRTILFFQLFDNLIVLIISVGIALVTGIPSSILVLQTNSLLSFNYPPPSYYILNFQALTSLLIYAALLLMLLVNYQRVKKLSRLSIQETEQSVEKGEPLWKKHNIDIFLFGFGISVYALIFLAFRFSIFMELFTSGIIILLILPAPFALVIGLLLIANRMIPIILNRTGTILWNKTGNLTAYAFKNVIRNQLPTTRAVILISVLIISILFFLAIPSSLVNNNYNNLYYNYGAEGNGSFGSAGYNSADIQTIHSNFSQYLIGFSPYIILGGGPFQPYTEYALMLVNTTTFLNSSYLHFDLGLTHNIQKDFTNLRMQNTSNTTIFNILIDKGTLSYRKESIGSNITIQSPSLQKLPTHVVDSFTNWPILKLYHSFNSPMLGIGDINYYLHTLNESLTNSPFSYVIESGVLFHFKSGVNQTQVSEWIQGNTTLSKITLVKNLQEQYSQGIQFRLELGEINNNIILAVIIAVIVLLMFAYMQFKDRKKEIFMERALGMKIHEVEYLFLIEMIILSFFSILLGFIIGVFLMVLLSVLLFNPLQTYPPFVINYPVNLIVLITGLLLLTSVITSFLTTYYVSKQDLNKSFSEL